MRDKPLGPIPSCRASGAEGGTGVSKIMTIKRINRSLLQRWEHPLLAVLVRSLPNWVTPDLLTTLGVLGSILAFAGYALSSLDTRFLLLAIAGIVLNWLGDSLDGTLARHRRHERPVYGFYIDHSTDVFSQALIALGLGLSPFVSLLSASIGLIGYLIVSLLLFIRAKLTNELTISFGFFGPTEARVLLILVTVLFLFLPPGYFMLPNLQMPLIDAVLIGVGIGGFLGGAVAVLRNARTLRRLDP